MVRYASAQPETIHTSRLAQAFIKTRNRRAWVDRAAMWVLLSCAALVLLPLFSILIDLVKEGIRSINLDFFTHLPKPVGENGGGMANAIVGTLILLFIALVVGVPLGLGTAIYMVEYSGSKMALVIRFVTDVLNGVPSIVYGIFAYTVFVVPTKSFSALSGGAALGIMMIPIVTRTSEEFIRLVPHTLREAGLALGIPRWRIIRDIVLDSAKGGILTGVMVALARVAGETAPLLFTAFGNRFWHQSLTEPIAALPLQIFAYAISPFDDWRRQAWAGALVLIGIIFAVNLFASFFVEAQAKRFYSKVK